MGTHISFRINGVVPFPVRYGGYGDCGIEGFAAFQEAEAGEVATEAPPENPDFSGVDERKLADMACGSDLIDCL